MYNYPFQNLYQIIEKNVNSSPNKTIIYEENLKISNREFKDRVDHVAQYLHTAAHIKPSDKVALVMSNSWQFIVNLFAISKIGGVVVAINNFLKQDEIAYIVNDSQATLLFASNKYAKETQELLAKTNLQKIIWVDGCPLENEKNIDHAKTLTPIQAATPAYPSKIEDTAFIVYTSGTTGKPKGAMLSFKNIFSNCEGSKILMNLTDGQIKLLCYLPMFHAFTLTVTIILPIYSNSGVIVIRSISGIKDFKNLLKQLLFKRCSFFVGVPDIYNAMSKAKLPWYFHWFHNVKGFISGAAPLSLETQKRFAQSFKRGKLIQGYGISECSPIVACNTPSDNQIGSVGKALSGYQVKIFDESNTELATNEVGEICVMGDCVMQGYYNRPNETAKAIVDGWFRTGDLGYMDNKGYIYIVDRLKDLIIHKGMNIYPSEIEAVIHTNPKVNTCAVIGMKDKEDNEIPIAYLELKEGETASEAEIKEFIKPSLAVFKQPRKIFFIEKLPRNATGKVLKRELRDLPNQLEQTN